MFRTRGDKIERSAASLKNRTIKAGYLQKKSTSAFGLAGWKQRWVVLTEDGYLYYFDSREAEKCSDVVPLQGGAAFPALDQSCDEGSAFMVGHNEWRTLCFAAERMDEYTEWLTVLQKKIAALPTNADESLATDEGYDGESCYSHMKKTRQAHDAHSMTFTSPRGSDAPVLNK